MIYYIKIKPLHTLLMYLLVTAMWLASCAYIVQILRQPLTVVRAASIVGLVLITCVMLVLVHYHWLRQQETTRRALDDSQRTFSTLMSNLPGMVYRCLNDEDWTMVFVSEGCQALLGYRPEQLLACKPVSFIDLVHPDDRATMHGVIDRALEANQSYELTYRIKTASGEEKWVWEQGQGVSLNGDIMLEGFITDITPQRRVTDALRESEARYRLLAENAQDAIYRYQLHPKEGFDYVSPAVTAFTGYTPDEIYAIDQAIHFIVHPDDHAVLSAPLSASIWRPLPLRLKHKDGHVVWVELRNTPRYGAEGELIAVEGIARDITAEREIAAALRESEAHLRSIFDGAAIGIMRLDLKGNILETNAALQTMLQYSAEELHQRPLADLLPEGDVNQLQQQFFSLAAGEQNEYRTEKLYRRKDGYLIWCRATRSLVRNVHGQPLFIISMLEDITEQREAEQALARRTEEIARLYELGKQLGQIVQLSELYGQVYRVVNETMACDSLILSTYDVGDNLIRCVYFQHDGVELDASELPPIPLEPEGMGTQSMAIRTGESLLLNDYQTHLNRASVKYYVSTDGLEDTTTPAEDENVPRSALIIPLKHESRVIGVLQVMSYQLNSYTDTDFNVLNALAPQVAIALQNSMLFEKAQREIAERKRAEEAEHAQRALAEALRDSAAALNESLDLDDVLDRILSSVGRVVPHDAAFILLIDDNRARIVRSWGFAEHGVGDQVPLLERTFTSLINEISLAENIPPFITQDIKTDPRWTTILPGTEWAHSHVGVPLKRSQEIVGFLGVFSAEIGFFSEADGDHLRAFADQAATALGNAHLYDEANLYARHMEERVRLRTEELQHAKERLEAILDNATEIMMLLRPDGIIEQANRMLSDTFEIEQDECIGKPLTCIVVPSQMAVLSGMLDTVTQTGQSQRTELDIHSKRSAFEAEITLTPIVKSGGQITGIVCHIHDITSHKEIERQLRETIESTNQLNEMKSRFVSIVSHEFRTPLAVIQTAIDLLVRYEDRLNSEQKIKEHTRIRAAIRNMVALLDNVLVFSRGEDKRMQLRPEPVDLNGFVRELIDEMKHSVGSKHIFALTLDGDPIATVDPRLLRHILLNLLTNAVKYSPPETTVKIDLNCMGREAIITVADQGIGIPDEDQTHLFEPFHRAGNATEIKGTGLGLAIVKQSVDLHHGTIRFESTEGVGTTFYIHLPYLLDNMQPISQFPLI
ncbi:MAG TPA: PAS domain S-box protein [Aggregatilinea sp.]|uniref:PAS domain S-box protein n=1 Tax=Aggregatilinea sp. TaxID=2806333 RepID=UPI002B7D8668|nr:PAS domain S-box protein [Aggregatilinea sp.]HML21766.1 PAS domain S-box protein [Aggregatilinea sp.]